MQGNQNGGGGSRNGKPLGFYADLMLQRKAEPQRAAAEEQPVRRDENPSNGMSATQKRYGLN